MKPRTKRILIIDDDEGFRLWLSDVLAQAGYEVIAVNNGRDALTKLSQLEPDLVVVNMLMSEMDGIQINQVIQQQAGDVKIVAIASVGHMYSVDYLKAAKHLGAHRTVLKPFAGSEFLKVVESLFANDNPGMN
jgi:CheY-like chemotaxis protein